MKKILLLIVIFSFTGFAQTYIVTQKPSYMPNTSTYTVKQEGTGAYENPKTYIDTQSAQHYKNLQNTITNSANQASQIYAQRAAAQAIINENRRIEEERQQREYSEQLRLQELEKKKLQEEKRKEEENNPNSILSKFKNAKANKENEELKIKLMQMEELLAEKEKAEKEKAELERLQKEKLEIERIEKEKEALKLKSKKRKN
jgi:hypothetical protein